jgi:NTE family protein
MSRTRIAIACQGGGSQTAFTAGAMRRLLDTVCREEFDVVALTGTSGGAVCSALVWYALHKGETPGWGRLIDFWKENAAQNPIEEALNRWIVASLRMVNRGMLPTLHFSPASPWVQAWMQWISMGFRETFTNFPALLRRYIDFDEIARWGPTSRRPVLMIGAADVTTGMLAKFNSTHEAIRVEHILASCAVPTIFPAVEINGSAYWDGLFSDNPPVEDLIRPGLLGTEQNVPEEIWLIKINPTARAKAPVEPQEIFDRRNQVQGNISLFHQLDHLEMINDMILGGAFRPEFLEHFGIKCAIRIPKSFAAEPDKPYHIPSIEMPDEIAGKLGYEDKIDRCGEYLDWLVEQGEAAATRFLAERAAVVGKAKPAGPGASPA